ncbi:metal ABC transporter permease [Haloplasma contractile]|uniref:Divalent manganese-zinc ABC transporter membrane protein n=1 Tax=Haloplasma contractile SSD-17B TaxID=1033810 RepID=U2EAF0_9MOLU|nr:metal ABC transporter permease [Haloplasma contractile]ERJ12073.1 Divalent manganese-zinc ABC transporter membrane protein [Haloplasma contractile SSD-17B]
MNPITDIIEALQYGFMLKAILVGVLVAVSSALLGIFIVLKKYSMIGDGLAHVSFAAIAISLLLSESPFFRSTISSFIPVESPLILSIILVILASFAILKLNEKANINGDAAIGLVSSFSIAFGYLIIFKSKGINVNLESFLFGNILFINNLDVILSIILSIIVILTIIFLYNSFFSITYDEEFSKVMGLKTKRINYLISILTSITIVLGIRVVGTMLISSMIIFPTVTALQLSKGFKQTIIASCLISVSSVILGIFISYIYDFPPGSMIVMINALFFVIVYMIQKVKL